MLIKIIDKKKIKKLYSRLFCDVQIEIGDKTLIENTNSNLNETIAKLMTTTTPRQRVKSDIKAFEGTKQRTESLNKIYHALKTIQATSTEVERTFSVAGNFLATNFSGN